MPTNKPASLPASQEPPTLSEVELAKAAMGKRLVTCSAVDRPHAASICMSSEGHSFPKLAVPVVEPRPSEPLMMLNALKAVKRLFSDDSKFYITKLGSPITNGDQAEIDAVFIAVDRAITANERLAERGCCQYCGADRSGPSAEAHSNDCPAAAAPPQVPSPEQWLASRYDRYGKPLSLTGDIQLSAQELIRMLEEFANDV